MKVNINRQLIGLEDLLFGVGTVEQTRHGETVTITKINSGNLPFEGLVTEDAVNTLTNKTLDDISNLVHANALHHAIKANGSITAGQPLVAVDTLGDGTIVAAVQTSLSQPCFGIANTTLVNGEIGQALSVGVFRNYDSTGLSIGQILYPDGAGSFTSVPTIASGNYNQPSAYVAEINGGNAQLIINFHSAHESASLISTDPTDRTYAIAANLENTIDQLDTELVAQDTRLDTNEATLSAQTLAVGNISKPLLHLPLDNSLDFERGEGTITFSRASTATYIDRYGVLKTASIDEPRFEKDGLLIEGASTNLFTYSEDFNTWGKYSSSIASNVITAPDGTLTADKVIGTDGTSTVHTAFKIPSYTAGITYTMSVFAKAGELDNFRMYFPTSAFISTEAVSCDLTNGTITSISANATATIYPAKDGWYRITLTSTADTTTTGNTHIGTGAVLGDGTSGLYIWGAQLEELPFASSYIPTTTTAVTRSAELCYASYEGNIPLIGEEISVAIDTSATHGITSPLLNPTIYEIETSTGILQAYTLAWWSAGEKAPLFYYGGTSQPVLVPDTKQDNRFVTMFDRTTAKVYINGEEKSSQARTPATDGVGTGIFLGVRHDGSRHLYGHVKNLRIYDKALNAEEARLA